MFSALMRILGLDPGSRITGIGIIDGESLVAARQLSLGGGEMPERLAGIFSGVTDAIAEFRPDVVAIETVFMSRNPQSAIKLGRPGARRSAPRSTPGWRCTNTPPG